MQLRSYLSILMKFALLLSGCICMVAINACTKPEATPKEKAKAAITQEMDSLNYLIDRYLMPLAKNGQSADSLQAVFYKCRKTYKKFEFISEYFTPSAARFVNGPPLDEIETAESEVNEPGGFQVIEEYLFPAFDTTGRAGLVQEVEKLKAHLLRIRTIWEVKGFTDAHLYDAMRLQVFRLISLGITGFDTPLSGNALTETASSLAFLQRTVAFYQPENDSARQVYAALQKSLQQAQAYLHTNTDFEEFNRMEFITGYANPISAQLLDLQQKSGFEPFAELRALRGDAATLFDNNAFNADFFAPHPDAYSSKAKVALGERLFYDPLLSSDNSRSCASCHQPEKAFTDGLPASAAFVKGKFVTRNAPTLLNAAFQHSQFYDSRSTTLEHQAIEVVENKQEMHGSLSDAIRKIHRQEPYVEAFKVAFTDIKDSIQPMHIQNAIASYIRSLVSLNSRFDQYVRGDKAALSQQEIKGFNLFMGKAKCATCHFTPLFNGTVPPAFVHTESEVLGVPARSNTNQLDSDPGKFAIYPFEQFKHAFKTPTVRNVALTAPYMHNGVFETLEEVVDFYDKAGGAGLGIDLPNQTLSAEPLDLKEDEKQALVAFMKSLTDLPAPARAIQ